MLINGKLPKLGKKAPVIDSRTLKLSNYLKPTPTFSPPPPALAPAPPEASWITKLEAAEKIPMYLNDVLGTCVPAAAGHMIQQWSFYAGHPWQPTDEDILLAYESVAGYIPGQPQTDQGCDILSFLKYWQKTGLGGHKILGYTSVDYLDLEEVQIAIELFGNVFTGLQLPLFVQGANLWTVPDGGIYSDEGQPGGWGGHCVPTPAGSPITKTCETWGTVLKMSNNFHHDYVDEAYAVLSPDWLETGNVSPSLLDLEQLEADLNELGVLSRKIT